jgi:peptidoglycan/xylan/chitin deacetylase (PgdA/CDA1 family)
MNKLSNMVSSKIYIILFAIIFIFAGCGGGNAVKNETKTSPLGTGKGSSPVASLPAKKIYLTFDADMTPGMKMQALSGKVDLWYDSKILDFLERSQVRSTIFVTGMFAEMYPDVVGRLSKNPLYEIANHTYDHAAFSSPCYNLKPLSSVDKKKEEVFKTQQVLEKLTGKKPKFFRFPGLCHSPQDDQIIQALGLTIVDADVISRDAFNRNKAAIARNILVKVRDDSVILMHLGGPNAPVSESVIQIIIPELKKMGYEFSLL